MTTKIDSSQIDFNYDKNRPESTVSDELATLSEGIITRKAPSLQATAANPPLSYSVGDYSILVDGTEQDKYVHSPRIFRDSRGILHVVYSSGLLHGYGGFTEANAVNPEGKIYYIRSKDNGKTWSSPRLVCEALPADPGLNPFRTVFDCHVAVSLSGKVGIVVSDIPPPSSQWGRFTGQTKYRWFTIENWGEGDLTDRGIFFTAVDDYARIYCGSIKVIPKTGGGYRYAFADYRRYQISPSLYMIGMWYWDEDFDQPPVEGAYIMQADGGNNETDFCFVDSMTGFAISRSDMSTYMTLDGGATPWVKIGTQANYPAPIASQFISPTLDSVDHDGEKYIMLGYAERGANPRMIRWLVTSVQNMLKFRDEVIAGRTYRPWGSPFQTGVAITGSGGYASPTIYMDGQILYVDITETTVSPTTGYMCSDIRLVRANSKSWFPDMSGFMIGTQFSRLNRWNNNERTFTPTLVADGTPGTITYSAQQGYVTALDVECRARTYLVCSLSGATGNLSIGGLPYNSINGNVGSRTVFPIFISGSSIASLPAGTQIWGMVLANSNQILLYKNSPGANLQRLLAEDITGTLTIYCLAEWLGL